MTRRRCSNEDPKAVSSFQSTSAALLRALGGPVSSDSGTARPLGRAWSDAFAYLATVLAQYDAEILRRSHLRSSGPSSAATRIVALLGYRASLGAAADGEVALLMDGPMRTGATTALRSAAFANRPPQVFEGQATERFMVSKNEWQLGEVRRPRTLGSLQRLAFVTDEFALAPGRLALLQIASKTDGGEPVWAAAPVTSVKSRPRPQGKTYVEVELGDAPALESAVSAERVMVFTPTVTARVTRWDPSDGSRPLSRAADDSRSVVVHLDSIYRQLAGGQPVVVQRTSGVSAPLIATAIISRVEEKEATFADQPHRAIHVPVTRAHLRGAPQLNETAFALGDSDADGFGTNVTRDELTFHFAFVEAGRLADLTATELVHTDFAAGIPVEGVVERPDDVDEEGNLEQDFLLEDARGQGARVRGVMAFGDDGHATFYVTDTKPLENIAWQVPIKVYGNLLEVTRGETVEDEILGSGDARQANQTFKLAKKPLTYVPSTRNDAEDTVQSTLSVRVNGELWTEVRSFYGRDPQDKVYIVRHDDAQETHVAFGDGRHGARLPTGVDNVVATYRFGAGAAAPPAGALTQLARPVKGVRGVRAPLAASPGKDPEDAAYLRKYAPRTALLLGRAVSAADFEALANKSAGVTRAVATWSWIEEELQAGVQLLYIGETDALTLETSLRNFADPTLPVRIIRARAVPADLRVEVEIEPSADRARVEDGVHRALVDSEDGVLTPKNIPIRSPLWLSRVFEVIANVPGVVSVATFEVRTKDEMTAESPAAGQGGFVKKPVQQLDLAARGSALCPKAGDYFDFSESGAVTVTALKEALGPLTRPRPDLPKGCP